MSRAVWNSRRRFNRACPARTAAQVFSGAAFPAGASSARRRDPVRYSWTRPAGWAPVCCRQPARVAAFLSTARLDPSTAGSDERPFYRAPRSGPTALLDRLHGLDDGEDAAEERFFERRFASVRTDAYQRRVLDALTAPKQGIVDVALHTGEVESLVRFLEYVEGAAPNRQARELARRLGSDLSLRARDGRESHHEHRAAFDYAVSDGAGDGAKG